MDLSKIKAQEMIDELKRRSERMVIVFDPGDQEPPIPDDEYLISYVGHYFEVLGLIEDAKHTFIHRCQKPGTYNA